VGGIYRRIYSPSVGEVLRRRRGGGVKAKGEGRENRWVRNLLRSDRIEYE